MTEKKKEKEIKLNETASEIWHANGFSALKLEIGELYSDLKEEKTQQQQQQNKTKTLNNCIQKSEINILSSSNLQNNISFFFHSLHNIKTMSHIFSVRRSTIQPPEKL